MSSPSFLARVMASAIGGTFTSTAALMFLSSKRTGSPWPGLNCTAHWLKGDEAAQTTRPDVIQTGTGVATSAIAILLWGSLYEAALGPGWPRCRRFLTVTAALGPTAVVADYGATPKRFTPGWELVFRKRDMALIYVALVLGMAMGSVLVRLCRRCNSTSDPIGMPFAP